MATMTWILAVMMLIVGLAAGYVIAAVVYMDMPRKERKRKDV